MTPPTTPIAPEGAQPAATDDGSTIWSHTPPGTLSQSCGIAFAAESDAIVHVPFRLVDGRIYVEVAVDGAGPFTFAVDTGASGVGRVDLSLVRDRHMVISGIATTSDGVSSANAGTVSVSAIRLGQLARENLTLIARDYREHMSPDAPFSGILGRAFFGDGLLVIDYPRRMLTFTRGPSLMRGAPGVMSYTRPFRIPVQIGDTVVEGNLDTGANVSFAMPREMYDRVIGGALQSAGSARLTNTTVATGTAVAHGPFRIGGVSITDASVKVPDRFPGLLVGAHALQHFIVLIDQRENTVGLCARGPIAYAP
jgi:predicted aspartyl protease